MLQIPYTKKVMNIENEESWMILIMHFLKWGKLAEGKQEAKKIEL